MSTNQNQIAPLQEKSIVDTVANKVKHLQANGDIAFPATYCPANALKSAFLTLQEIKDKNDKPALEICTKESVANALLDMCVQGLNPIKKQCYFIVYGTKLQLQRSYFGDMHIAKSVCPDIEDIVAEVVYKGQKFKYEKKRGKIVIVEHEMQLGDDSNPLVGAYCQIFYKDGSENTTVMSIDEIKKSWAMSKAYPFDENGNLKLKSTHAKYQAEMAKKTVTRRACKVIINSSDDSSLLVKTFNRSDADMVEAEARDEISQNANRVIVDIDTGEVQDVVPQDTAFDDFADIDDIIEDDLP